jgi:putative addiction module killer protein
MANQVRKTAKFDAWLSGLKDQRAKGAIAARITRIENGLHGDHKDLGGGLTEYRVDVGPGYRLYSTRQGKALIFLLCGGDKASQKADIAEARTMIDLLEAEKKAAKEARKKTKQK